MNYLMKYDLKKAIDIDRNFSHSDFGPVDSWGLGLNSADYIMLNESYYRHGPVTPDNVKYFVGPIIRAEKISRGTKSVLNKMKKSGKLVFLDSSVPNDIIRIIQKHQDIRDYNQTEIPEEAKPYILTCSLNKMLGK